MPCASCCGLEPVGDCEPKISIMPITVPKRPSSGDAVAMVRATAMMDAARRNQIGQPAACSIANNRRPYSFSDCARGLYGKGTLPGKLTRCSKNAPRVVAELQAVVDFAISTKSCGQVCGLSMKSARSARHETRRVGRDQKLSSL